jgi:uncharacterized protein (TIGR00725 family)
VPDRPGPLILAPHTIGVMGSGSEEYEEDARVVGAVLADLGVNLLTGGGPGVMRAVGKSFTRHPGRRGICIGIIPCASESDRVTPKAGYPNEFVELAIRTHLPYSGKKGTHDLSRNHINVLTCDAIIALPGEHGTASEIHLALRYARPVVVYAGDDRQLPHFPTSVRRVHSRQELTAFIRSVIAG